MNEKVNNVALRRLDDLKLQKPYYPFSPFLLLPVSIASPINDSAYSEGASLLVAAVFLNSWHNKIIGNTSMYKKLPMLLWNGFHPIVSRPNLKATAPSSISSIKILMERSSRKRKKKDGFYRFCLVNCPENFALSCTLHCSALPLWFMCYYSTQSKWAHHNSWLNSLPKVTLDNKFLIRNSS